MKKKVIAILVSLLFITMIPSAIGEIADSESDFKENNLDFDRVYMRAWLFYKLRKGNHNTFFAYRLVVWYNISSEPYREAYWFKWVTFKDSAYIGRMYEVGLGLLTCIFGYVGDIEIH